MGGQESWILSCNAGAGRNVRNESGEGRSSHISMLKRQ